MSDKNIKITLKLLNHIGCELDRQEITAVDDNDVSDAIHDALKCWTLAPGDTIQIS